MASFRIMSEGININFLKLSNIEVEYKGADPQTGYALCQANISSLISYYNELQFGQTLFPVASQVMATGQNSSSTATWSYNASTGVITMLCPSNPRVTKVDIYYLGK